MRDAFFKADRRGSHASGSIKLRASFPSLTGCSKPASAILASAVDSPRVITRCGSSPASGGPPLGGRAGEPLAANALLLLLYSGLYVTYLHLPNFMSTLTLTL